MRLPLLALRDMVLFPHMVVPLFVGRERSIAALDAALAYGKMIFLAAQRNPKTEDPAAEEIHQVGTICQVIQLLKLPDGTVKVLVEGRQRAVIRTFITGQDHFLVEVEPVGDKRATGAEVAALLRATQGCFEEYARLAKKIADDVLTPLLQIEEPAKFADSVMTHLSLSMDDRQALLALFDPAARLEKIMALLEGEIEILHLEKRIKSRVKKQMEKAQREYYLNEQMRAIQKELGTKDEFKQELAELEERAAQLQLSEEARHKVQGELRKLRLMSPMSAEAAVVRNYLDWLLSLPWGKYVEENRNLQTAEQVLDEDHHGLEKVKERIVEYLAVQNLVGRLKGPILCLVGPPGVGKTSLARSIARATGRGFVKMSLGGVRDEAEIRGHRRTYVGALPGKIMHNLKRAGSSNPVFLLDEIDKMTADFRGDPSSALLEVLDPEQNATFVDHYLDVEFDLSRVLFIATANSLHGIPRALLDRMEIINLAGYTELEKLHIAGRYLVPRQLAEHGLAATGVTFSSNALQTIIRRYTREAGVRALERALATISRKIARQVARGRRRTFTVQPRQVAEYLGAPRFTYGKQQEQDAIGLVTGLAWTEVGGELLNIEAVIVSGKGKLLITGKLGEVMQESVQAAMTYARSRAGYLGLDHDFYQNLDVHIHVPEGAIPKDGPSAGIAIATAIISSLTSSPVRRDVAMTGELTLQGRVLAIGGLKEKLLAARRAGIRTVLIPADNDRDLTEIPKEIMQGLKIRPVQHMDDVLEWSLRGGIRAGVSSPRLNQHQIPDAPLTAH